MVRILSTCICLLLCTPVSLAQDEQWQAKSTESYRGKKSEKLLKSSAGITDDKGVAAKNSLTAAQKSPARVIAKDTMAHPVNSDFWVYDARSHLLEDFDHDNYYYVFNVRFDVDTIYTHADLYARLYLGDGDVYREYHTTSVFHIDDTDGDDEFEVETELLNGYRSWDYDILIEVYEAGSDHLVAVYNQQDDADLSLLPLESYDYEYQYVPNEVRVSRSIERGGSIGLLLPLIAMSLIRMRKK